jgi:DNA-binding MarR family transcriptional regulator
MTSPLNTEDYAALATFRYALRKFLRFSKEFLAAKAKLTPEQYEALLALKAFSTSNGLLVGELSERLQVKHHTAVSLTDKLVAQKLATRRRGRSDRRQVYVKLTGAGSKLLTSLAAVHRKEMRVRSSEMIDPLKRLQR